MICFLTKSRAVRGRIGPEAVLPPSSALLRNDTVFEVMMMRGLAVFPRIWSITGALRISSLPQVRTHFISSPRKILAFQLTRRLFSSDRAKQAVKPGAVLVVDGQPHKVKKITQGKRGKGGGYVRYCFN